MRTGIYIACIPERYLMDSIDIIQQSFKTGYEKTYEQVYSDRNFVHEFFFTYGRKAGASKCATGS